MKSKILLLSALLILVLVQGQASIATLDLNQQGQLPFGSQKSEIQIPNNCPFIADEPTGPNRSINVLAGKQTAFYGPADNESVRSLVGYADYFVAQTALYGNGEAIKENVRYLHNHEVKVILVAYWWDLGPIETEVNGWKDMDAMLSTGINATDYVKTRIRNCINNIGAEYIWGLSLSEEEGVYPSETPATAVLIAWYLNYFYDWLHEEFPGINVVQWPAPGEFLIDQSDYYVKADAICFDDYNYNMTFVSQLASGLRNQYLDKPFIFIVCATWDLGWSTVHTNTYMKWATYTVAKWADAIGYFAFNSGNASWTAPDWAYELALKLCNQIHLMDSSTVYADTEWFYSWLGNDTMTESADNWFSSSWYTWETPGLYTSLSADHLAGASSVNLTKTFAGKGTFYYQPFAHYLWVPTGSDVPPQESINITGLERIVFWVKGQGWNGLTNTNTCLCLKGYNSLKSSYGTLTLPDFSNLLVDGQWHQVVYYAPLNSSWFNDWTGYAWQVEVISDYDSSPTSNSTTILLDGFEIQAFDNGIVRNETSLSDYAIETDGWLQVRGNAYFERHFSPVSSWYVQWRGDGDVEILVDGFWIPAPSNGTITHGVASAFRLYNGSYDWFKINSVSELQIGHVYHDPAAPAVLDEIHVFATIRNNATLDTALCYWRLDDGDWNTTTMSHIMASDYRTNSPFLVNRAASLEYFVWANDTNGNHVRSPSYFFDILDDMPPSISEVRTLPALPTADDAVCVLGTFSDNGAVDSALCFWRVEGENWSSTQMHPLSGDLFCSTDDIPKYPADTVIQYYLWANDTGSNTILFPAGAPTVYFSYIVAEGMDYLPPSLSVTWIPSETSVCGLVHFNAEADDTSGIARVEFYLDGGLQYTDYVAPYEWTWSSALSQDGQHNLNVIAFDAWNNSREVNVSLTSDNSEPSVYVNSPTNQTILSAPSAVNVIVTAIDASGLDMVLLNYSTGMSWSTIAMIQNGSNFEAITPIFPHGTVLQLRVYVNDTLGNGVWSDLYEYLLIDSYGPVVSAPVLQPEVPTSFDTVTITTTVTDSSGVSAVLLSYRVDAGTWSNLTMVLSSAYWVNIPAIATGSTVSYRMYANDTNGLWTITPIYEYTVVPFDVLPPDVNLVSWSPTIPNDSQSVEVTVHATDPSGVTQMILSYHEGILWHNVTMTLSGGDYIGTIPALDYSTSVLFKVYACDGQGNWGVTPMGSYTVTSSDQDGPEVLMLTWSPSIPTEEDDVVVCAELSDMNGVSTAILCYGQGTALVNVTMTFNGTGYIAIIRAYPIGIQVNLCLYARDIRDNWAISEWMMYVVSASDATPPLIGSISWTPLQPLSNESILVRANVADEHPITLVLLHYFDGHVWRNLTMDRLSSTPDEYMGELPAIGTAGTIKIQVLACDSSGNWGFSDIIELEIEGAPIPTTPITTTTTTPPSTTPYVDTTLIGAMGALVVGLPTGIAVGIILSYLVKKKRDRK